jgi:hypothetical protein
MCLETVVMLPQQFGAMKNIRSNTHRHTDVRGAYWTDFPHAGSVASPPVDGGGGCISIELYGLRGNAISRDFIYVEVPGLRPGYGFLPRLHRNISS